MGIQKEQGTSVTLSPGSPPFGRAIPNGGPLLRAGPPKIGCLQFCDELSRFESDGQRHFQELDNIEPSFAAFVLRDERLGSVQAGGNFRLCQVRFEAPFPDLTTEEHAPGAEA